MLTELSVGTNYIPVETPKQENLGPLSPVGVKFAPCFMKLLCKCGVYCPAMNARNPAMVKSDDE